MVPDTYLALGVENVIARKAFRESTCIFVVGSPVLAADATWLWKVGRIPICLRRVICSPRMWPHRPIQPPSYGVFELDRHDPTDCIQNHG